MSLKKEQLLSLYNTIENPVLTEWDVCNYLFEGLENYVFEAWEYDFDEFGDPKRLYPECDPSLIDIAISYTWKDALKDKYIPKFSDRARAIIRKHMQEQGYDDKILCKLNDKELFNDWTYKDIQSIFLKNRYSLPTSYAPLDWLIELNSMLKNPDLSDKERLIIDLALMKTLGKSYVPNINYELLSAPECDFAKKFIIEAITMHGQKIIGIVGEDYLKKLVEQDTLNRLKEDGYKDSVISSKIFSDIVDSDLINIKNDMVVRQRLMNMGKPSNADEAIFRKVYCAAWEAQNTGYCGALEDRCMGNSVKYMLEEKHLPTEHDNENAVLSKIVHNILSKHDWSLDKTVAVFKSMYPPNVFTDDDYEIAYIKAAETSKRINDLLAKKVVSNGSIKNTVKKAYQDALVDYGFKIGQTLSAHEGLKLYNFEDNTPDIVDDIDFDVIFRLNQNESVLLANNCDALVHYIAQYSPSVPTKVRSCEYAPYDYSRLCLSFLDTQCVSSIDAPNKTHSSVNVASR